MRKMLTTIIAAGLIGYGCNNGKEESAAMEGFSKAGMKIGEDSVWVGDWHYGNQVFLPIPVLFVKGTKGFSQYILEHMPTGAYENKEGTIFLRLSPYRATRMAGPKTNYRWIKLYNEAAENKEYLMERYEISIDEENQKAMAYLDSLGNHATTSAITMKFE